MDSNAHEYALSVKSYPHDYKLEVVYLM
jgi:hypothetical protein